MAYVGSTAGTTSTNPPYKIFGRLGGVSAITTAGGGPSLWMYNSPDDPAAMASTGYITDGRLLGMKTGDVMLSVLATGSSIGFAMGVIQCATATTNYACWYTSTGGMVVTSK